MVVKTSAITIIPKGSSKITKSSPSALTSFNKGGGKISRVNFNRPINPTGTDLGGGDNAGLVDALVETNRILVEIQKQLALDFANRIADQDKQLRSDRKKISKNKFLAKEAALEAGKRITKLGGKVIGKITSPVGNVFGNLFKFLGTIFTGQLISTALSWLQNPENYAKMKKIGEWMSDNWGLVLGGLTTLAAGGVIVSLAAGIGGLTTLFGAIAAGSTMVIGAGLFFAGSDQGIKIIEGIIKALLPDMFEHGMINKMPDNRTYDARQIWISLDKRLAEMGGRSKENYEKLLEILKKERADLGPGGGNIWDKALGKQDRYDYAIYELEQALAEYSSGSATTGSRAKGGPVWPGQMFEVNDGPGRKREMLLSGGYGYVLDGNKTEQILALSSNPANVVVIDGGTEYEGEVPTISGNATGVTLYESKNPLNPFMNIVPEILGIVL